MARIVGVDLPKNKRGEIGLTYIYGIGRSTARAILEKAQISYDVKVKDWSDENVAAIRNRDRPARATRWKASSARPFSSTSSA